MEEIQEIRKKLNDIITNTVRPLREQLDELLNNEAKKICPFSIDDEITLDNGKKGVVKMITYYSLDYKFSKFNEFDGFSNLFETDNIDDYYAYEIDNKEFSITWRISGLRMIKNNTEVGKVVFNDISPVAFDVDNENMTVSRKKLNTMVDNADFITDFVELK